MTAGVAVAAILVAWLAGSRWTRWRMRENGLRSALTQLAGADKQVKLARKAMFFVAILVVAIAEYWVKFHR